MDTALAFYSYDIQDGDTPDIVADKYYGDSYRYWMVPYANQMIDVQAQWPMGPNLFNDYLVDKYSAAAATYYSVPTATASQVLSYIQITVQNYIKQVVTIDGISSTKVTNKYVINLDDYTILEPSTVVKPLPNNASVTQIVSKYIQYIYDYEIELNESKRNISLVNAAYAGAMEKQLTSLLG